MFHDDIAAIATPPGRSAVALVRIAGPAAAEIGSRVLRPFASHPDRMARRARVVDPNTGDLVDEVLYTFFSGPRSYTGEDVLEISTHGGLLVPLQVLECALGGGARLALPGEFTRRALLNGKLDLLQAEAVGDLTDATAPRQSRAALMQLDRGMSRRLEQLRTDILGLDAMVCYEIDFPEEDDGPVPPERIEAAADRLADAMRSLLSTAVEGERLREGAMVVIAGRPNTGKSSLFNALLGAERAIVTDIEGTTRDAIDAPITCEGFPFRLVDTAGLRETDDVLERLGIEVSRRYLEGADVILLCVEADRGLDASERQFLAEVSAPAMIVRTKADLHPGAEAPAEHTPVSVETGLGLDRVRARLARIAFGGLIDRVDLEPFVTRARHRVALTRALDELVGFRAAREQGFESAVSAVHLHAAVAALEDIIGIVTADDVLDRVFSMFCIGK